MWCHVHVQKNWILECCTDQFSGAGLFDLFELSVKWESECKELNNAATPADLHLWVVTPLWIQ